MYQRPRMLAEFDLRVARVCAFIVGAMLVAYGNWGLGSSEEVAIATTVLRITLILAGIWCFYVAVFNKVTALKNVEHDGSADPLVGLAVYAILIVSFLVALVLPQRSNKNP